MLFLHAKNLPKYAFSGQYAFYLITECIMSTTQNLAHNVNSGLLVMSLRSFEGEDMMKCVFILRNVLHFLNYGITGFDQTPPTLMEHLFDIFIALNTQFCNYVQNLKDFHRLRTNTPESLFLQVRDYYNNIITKPGAVWLRTKKTKVAFTAGAPTTQQKPAGGNSHQASQ